MKYIYTNTPIEKAAKYTADKLIEHLSKGERVLWLLSGGSGSAIAVAAGKKLAGVNLSNLFVTMTDERYGDVGHKDENWQQLLDAGINLPGANLYRPLIGKDIQKTTTKLNDWLDEQYKKSEYIFGIFGMGTDGHTAGIKPGSPAVTSTKYAEYFTGDDFKRITITFESIKNVCEAVIQVSGTDKRPALQKFIHENLPLNKQPAQILKTIPNSILYTNNHKGEL